MTAISGRRALPSQVVCNTGPIIALSRVGQLDIILKIIPSVRIPRMVEREIQQGTATPDESLRAWLKTIVLQDPSDPPDAFLTAELDAGEASVIALASELGIGVLMDERKGRRVASLAYGLPVIGTGRLLIEAKERGFIGAIRPLMDQMRAGGYYLSDRLFQSLCCEAGESSAS